MSHVNSLLVVSKNPQRYLCADPESHGISNCPLLSIFHFLCAQVFPPLLSNPHRGISTRLHKLHSSPNAVEMSKLSTAGRICSQHRGSLNHSNIVFDDLDSFLRLFE